MKKTIIFILVLSIAASMMLLTSFADSSVVKFYDYVDDGNQFYVMFDSVLVNNEVVGIDGKGEDYLFENDHVLKGPADSFGVRGWVASGEDIVSFGYMVDGGQPQMSADFKAFTGDDVVGAATSQGYPYCSRYWITVDATALEGAHRYTFLCKLADGETVIMASGFGNDIEFTFSADGADVAPTATPEPSGPVENGPAIILAFDDEEKYLDGSFFLSNVNEIEDMYFDAEKKCEVISMAAVGDPYFSVPLGQLAMEDEAYEVDTAIYKYMQIGVRFNAAAAGTTGQFYFQTDEYPNIDERKDMRFSYKPTDDYQYVTVNMAKNSCWSGYLADSRLDPLSPSNSECDYELYYIAFFSTEEEAKAFGEKWLVEGTDAYPTPAATPTKAPTTAPTAFPTMIPTSVPTEEPTPAVIDEPEDNKDNKKANTGLIIGLAAGSAAVVAGGVIAFVALKKKKK